MNIGERVGWTKIVTSEDIDIHMSEIGQAETNAKLVLEMLTDFPLDSNSKLFIPGCGTGQMFDYIRPNQMGDYKFIFSDLNPNFLEKLKRRLSKYPNVNYSLYIDDIESTKLSGSYGGVLSVLLLQHINWKEGIEKMVGFNPLKMYFIIQSQGNKDHPVSKERILRNSIAKFAEVANPTLVPIAGLIDYLERRNYQLCKTYKKVVPDDKIMNGLVFKKM